MDMTWTMILEKTTYMLRSTGSFKRFWTNHLTQYRNVHENEDTFHKSIKERREFYEGNIAICHKFYRYQGFITLLPGDIPFIS